MKRSLWGWIAALAACGGGQATDDDSAPPDSAIVDAPLSPDTPIILYNAVPANCTATAEAIYIAPATLPADRGAITACSLGPNLDTAATQALMTETGADGIVAQTGVQTVKLAYRTVRSDGTPTITTATAYLPIAPRTLPVPVILVGRSTSGMADSCAPSHEATPAANYAMPFASRGFLAIVPDYAGLGTAGEHAYLDNHEAAIELFDGVTALRNLLPSGAVGAPVGAVGYSQGGGIVLSLQALELALTGAHHLKAVAAIAPEWPISTRSFGYEDVLRNPDRLTSLAGLSSPTVTILRHYGFLANRLGAAHAGDSFPVDERASIADEIHDYCTIELGGALDAQQRHLRDLVDDTFRTQVLACIDHDPASCTGTGAAFHAWMQSDFVTADPAGARVLIVQGLADQVMPAAGEAACDVAKLRAEGVTPEVYVDTTATHDTVLERRIEDVEAWIEAAVTDAPTPTLPTTVLPACSR